MGLISALKGNASEVSSAKLEKEFAAVFVEGESIDSAYKVLRDLFVFTQKRLILVDRQGLTGKKVEYHSIPYKSITQFSVETAGSFDADAELRIWISGRSAPLQKEFKKGTDVLGIQRSMAQHILG